MMAGDEVRSQLERILRSKRFSASERLSRFLRYTVEAVLAGRGGELKEYLIGVEVFDRRSSYDPRLEPIVRVEARRLRSRLREYYEQEGRGDALRIVLPTGKYVPEFQTGGEPTVTASPKERRLAVLPFAARSGNEEDEYFSEGLAEELIHALTRVDGLTVVAWPSAHEFKGEPVDLRRVAEQLGVTSVLEGSVRRQGDRLRIAAQLICATSGAYLWSETYERRMEDVFAIQEEIAQAIAAKFLPQAQREPLCSPRPASLDAYHAYLWGRYHWNKRSYAALEKAKTFFEEAIAADPNYAAAWAGLADTYAVLGEWGNRPQGEFHAPARAAAERALELDETLAEAHASLGLVLSHVDHQLEAARRHYERSLELNPGYASARHWYATSYLTPVGRLTDALEEVRLARELDPLSLIIGTSVGNVLYFARQYEESLPEFERVLRRKPAFHRATLGIGRSLVELGRYDEGIACLRQIADEPDFVIVKALLGHAYAVSGQTSQARAVLAELEALSRTRYVSDFAFARVHLGLGDLDSAFAALERTLAARDSHLMHLKVGPIFDCLRADPRYPRLLARVGLGLTVS